MKTTLLKIAASSTAVATLAGMVSIFIASGKLGTASAVLALGAVGLYVVGVSSKD